ncbi:MAG: hypothetical protein V3S64_00210, partial [bacterium]
MKNRSHGDPESQALALFAGRPSILEAFYDLTEKGFMDIRWNPLDDPVQWESKKKPTEKELERILALRVFNKKGYIESVTDQGTANYVVSADDWAMKVRHAL